MGLWILAWQDRHVGKIGFVGRFRKLQGGRCLYHLDAILQAIWSLSCACDKSGIMPRPLDRSTWKKSSNILTLDQAIPTRIRTLSGWSKYFRQCSARVEVGIIWYCILSMVVQMQPALKRNSHPAAKLSQNGNEVFLVLLRRHLWALLVSKFLIKLREYSQVLQLMRVCLCYRFHRPALDFPAKLGAIERGICILAFICHLIWKCFVAFCKAGALGLTAPPALPGLANTSFGVTKIVCGNRKENWPMLSTVKELTVSEFIVCPNTFVLQVYVYAFLSQ